MLEIQELKKAKQAFKKRDHKATLVQNTDRYTIIDWRRADGGGDYYVNYIIDKKRGSLIISGDLGDCIATWYNPNNVHHIAQYIQHIYYFIGKFQCASDCYDYDDDEIINDIEDELEQTEVEHTEEFEDDWDNFKYEVPDYVNKHGFFPNGDVADFLEKYLGDDWWEGSSTWGRTVNPRVYLWAAGLKMAVDQLDVEGVLSKED